ncbi:MAG: GNAT family N-acetyltransferase [Flavobacteriales bacterium]|nr:GNAT family N-acetyltransferase [Flavobacteriales bacterium]
MAEYQLLNTTDFVTTLEKLAIIDFLMDNLDKYDDSRENVSNAIEYALSKFPHQGGFVLMARERGKIIGVSVINRTNFQGYFAENILVFIVVSKEMRRQGIAANLLSQTKVYSKGSILVRMNQDEQNFPLFERAGFQMSKTEYLFKR